MPFSRPIPVTQPWAEARANWESAIAHCAGEAFRQFQARMGHRSALEEVVISDGAAVLDIEDVPALIVRCLGPERLAAEGDAFRAAMQAYAARAAARALDSFSHSPPDPI